MSIKTWKEEFYPTTAHSTRYNRATNKEKIEHSFFKWIGLLDENLKKHDVFKSKPSSFNTLHGGIEDAENTLHDGIEDTEGEKFLTNADSCSLCANFCCEDCPVSLADVECSSSESKYYIWRDTGDPKPMIELLKKLLDNEEKDKTFIQNDTGDLVEEVGVLGSIENVRCRYPMLIKDMKLITNVVSFDRTESDEILQTILSKYNISQIETQRLLEIAYEDR